MFPYRVKYTESEYEIQNNDLLYKTTPKFPNTFEQLGKTLEIQKMKNLKFLFCNLYKLHNSYVVHFGNFGIYRFFCIFIFIYITRVGLLHV